MRCEDQSLQNKNDKSHVAKVLYLTHTRAQEPGCGAIVTLFIHFQKSWLLGFLIDERLEKTKKREWVATNGKPTKRVR